MTNQRILRRRLLGIEVITPRHSHRHVRLPGAEPDLAHEHVLHLELVAVLSGNEQHTRLSGSGE
jgi:uncharacterized Fe-S cluster-containing radical SAM superfamily protein